MHGHEASNGAKVDAAIQVEEAEMLAKKGKNKKEEVESEQV